MANIIEALLQENLITSEQLNDARDKKLGAKKPLQDLLVEMGFVEEEDLARVASKIFNMPVTDLSREAMDPAVLKIVPYDASKKYGVFPLREEGGAILVVMSNPQDIMVLDDLSAITGKQMKAVLGKKSSISDAIEKYYQLDDDVYDLLKNAVEDAQIEVIKEEKDDGAVETEALEDDFSPVIRLVSLVINDAVKSRASDIHIEPQEKYTEVRYRIDGNLKNVMKIPQKITSPFVTRIKILAEMDIAEKRKPQDGRIRVLVAGRKIDLRISTIPTFYGEKVVARLLDKNEAKTQLDKLGFQEDELALFKDAIKSPQGMVLVTGPTGSGKTSTLYAGLNFVKRETKNIITIEDPIEYLIDGVNQIQVNPVKDVTFANGLKSILRQDPDVILVGEIRDRDTADIAFRASMTGHLVLSTLHTNSSVASITRLLDIGLESYLIASSVIMIVAQRLVRCICDNCKEEYTPPEALLNKFKGYIEKYGIKKFYRGAGCDKCDFTGYLGRTAILEILKFNEEIKNLITQKVAESTILKEARKDGMKTLFEASVEKVAQGVSSLEEIEEIAGTIEGTGEIPKVEPTIIQKAKPFVTEEPAKKEPAPPEEQAVGGDKPRLLVADDEDDIRKVIVKRLEMSGYEVLQAGNGKLAVQEAVKNKPDLIIMDVMMPEMDGFQATKVLRSRLDTAGIPILMLTAKKDKESELEGLDAGADDYITKPFDKDKLLARIKMLLKRRSK